MKWRVALLAFMVLGLFAYLLSIPRMLWAIISGSDQAKIIALAYDQLGNAVTNGSEDETISSRAGRAMLKGKRWGCVLCRCLDWFQKDHCLISIEKQFAEEQIPDQIKTG